MTDVTEKLKSPLTVALAKAQLKMTSPKLNKTNPHFRSKYADLTSVIDATVKILNEHGMIVTQTMHLREGGFFLLTRLAHESGEAIESYYPLPTGGTEQARGSALTYARRYSLSAICCVSADEDDDGNSTIEGKAAPKAKPKAEAPAKQTVEKLEPYEIPRPEGGTAVGWASKYIEQISMCESAVEVGLWRKSNLVALKALKDNAEKVYEKLDAAEQEKLKALGA